MLDIFAGSNTTGSVAERLNRRWLAFELDREYLAASAFRFSEGFADDSDFTSIHAEILANIPTMLRNRNAQTELALKENHTTYRTKRKQ